jgi:hypothetical protein
MVWTPPTARTAAPTGANSRPCKDHRESQVSPGERGQGRGGAFKVAVLAGD